MGRRYYLVADGERLYRDTVQAISTLAQKVANRTGEDVQVHYEDRIGRGKSHRKAPSKGTATYRRNPGDVWTYTTVFAGRLMGYHYSVYKNGVGVLNSRKGYRTKAMADNAAKRAIKAQGGTPAAKNPASTRKIRKAKRSGQAKRGYYVEWKFGTHVERARYGNKGMATIKANALKRDGARSVRVYGA